MDGFIACFEGLDDPRSGNRFIRFDAAPGPLLVNYRAEVMVHCEPVDPALGDDGRDVALGGFRCLLVVHATASLRPTADRLRSGRGRLRRRSPARQ